MKIGSKSLLFGVHQFAWHPITVWLAWWKLYRSFPSWRETVCIVVHDWGYWGCSTMDGPEGEEHPYLGAWLMGWLFGSDYHNLVLRHSRFLAIRDSAEPSKLCWADKVSMVYDPCWFYLFRARLSGELKEYRALGVQRNNIPLGVPDRDWYRTLRDKMLELSKVKAKEFESMTLSRLMDLAEAVPFTLLPNSCEPAFLYTFYSGETVNELSKALKGCGHTHLAKAVRHGIYWVRQIADLDENTDGLRQLRKLEWDASQPDWSWNGMPTITKNHVTPNLAQRAKDQHATD